ncbi:MAG: FeoA family protein [Bacteroidota bacterium]
MAQMSLNTLLPGEHGIVERVESVKSSIKQRLLEMGLTKGTDIEIIRFAPMGDPIEISVRGYRLSLRRVEAESVIVLKYSQ